ncbi:aspartate aminotransferase family protein [Candidatus Bathyarchaeota archaeon]|nr:aspartate aminotransferase family protein [Candidatus Bathyarchaeota archaeon]RJS81919.1 MAG: aspartate aminotransferase family protein [Candidatus Bathyarchaeota archaeon]
MYGAHVYSKYPITIVKGKGALLWDKEGKEYIDFMGGYGVSIIGHCHPRVVNAIKEQCEKLITCHGSLYNDKRAEFLEKIVNITPKTLEKAFLCNSGAESVECALKLALKYTGKTEVVAMKRGYHGKTLGALSATWNMKYRKPFRQVIHPNVKFVPFGDAEALRETVSNNTAAVIVEPIQGEGGVNIPPNGYLTEVQEICREKDVLLIVDEIQTGLGRTGKLWACQHWKVEPDVMCLAKGIAGGVPMGVTLARREVMDSLKVGEHTSTFGGNPLACAAASATIDVLISEKLPERAAELGNFFIEELRGLQDEFKVVRDVRGLGLMVGLESRFDVYNILMKALDYGLILLYAGRNVLRFLPPLVISREQIQRGITVLRELLTEEEKARKI